LGENGLFPISRELILSKLKKPELPEKVRPYTPPEVIFISSDGARISAPIRTLGNPSETNAIIAKVQRGEHSELDLIKLLKSAQLAFANIEVLKITNDTLIEMDKDKKKRTQRLTKQLDKGRIMGVEVLEKRQAAVQSKRVAKEEKQQEKLFWDT